VKRGQREDIALEFLSMCVPFHFHPDTTQTPLPRRYKGNEAAFMEAFDPIYKMGYITLLKAVQHAQEMRGDRVNRHQRRLTLVSFPFDTQNDLRLRILPHIIYLYSIYFSYISHSHLIIQYIFLTHIS
jgi:hypothetical protein